MSDQLTPEFIADNLEILIADFDHIGGFTVDEITDFILSTWVLLDVIDTGAFDEDDNLQPDTYLYQLNERLISHIHNKDFAGFCGLLKDELLIGEKYEVLSFMKSL